MWFHIIQNSLLRLETAFWTQTEVFFSPCLEPLLWRLNVGLTAYKACVLPLSYSSSLFTRLWLQSLYKTILPPLPHCTGASGWGTKWVTQTQAANSTARWGGRGEEKEKPEVNGSTPLCVLWGRWRQRERYGMNEQRMPAGDRWEGRSKGGKGSQNSIFTLGTTSSIYKPNLGISPFEHRRLTLSKHAADGALCDTTDVKHCLQLHHF